MSPTQEEALFALALTKPTAERAAWLDRECRDNKALRARLEALLAEHDETDGALADATSAAKGTMKLEFADEPKDGTVGQVIGRY